MEHPIAVAVAERWVEVAEADQEPEAVDRLVERLLAVADACRSVMRDGEPEITSAVQFAECAKVADRLRDLEPVDPLLARRARELVEQVDAGGAAHWQDPVRTVVVSGASMLFAFGGAALGGQAGNVTTVVVTAVLGSTALFATVLAARRPAWRANADVIMPMVRRHGL